jgi:hypothetical protein
LFGLGQDAGGRKQEVTGQPVGLLLMTMPLEYAGLFGGRVFQHSADQDALQDAFGLTLTAPGTLLTHALSDNIVPAQCTSPVGMQHKP